jgi:hypothetical protein
MSNRAVVIVLVLLLTVARPSIALTLFTVL